MGKELTKLSVVGLCLVAGFFLVWRHLSQRTVEGVASIEPGQALVVLCVNSSCQYQSQMDKRSYYEEVEKRLRANPQQSQPALICSQCGKNSVYRGVQCPSCDHAFRYGGVPHDAADRCPKCRYSQMEMDRKNQGK